MHVWEGTLRPKNGDIERTCEWWKSNLKVSGAEGFENGEAVSRMDGENSVLIIRHTFDNLAHEERVFDAWHRTLHHNGMNMLMVHPLFTGITYFIRTKVMYQRFAIICNRRELDTLWPHIN